MSQSEKSLEEKIIEDIKKTGYPTQIVSGSILEARGWAVEHSPSFVDDFTGQNREYDIRASRAWTVDGGDRLTSLVVNLMIECKKSDKRQWVFFTTPEDHSKTLNTRYIQTDRSFQGFLPLSPADTKSKIKPQDIEAIHHYFKQPRLARSYYEPVLSQQHTGGQEPQTIYTACMSAVKALVFTKKYVGWEQRVIKFYYPVVVFGGLLFEAIVDADREVSLLPSDHIQLAFNHVELGRSFSPVPGSSGIPRAYDKPLLVDVVRDSYLGQFLDGIEAEHGILSDWASQAVGAGWQP